MTTLGEPLNDDEFQELIQLGLNEDETKVNIDCKHLLFIFMFILFFLF